MGFHMDYGSIQAKEVLTLTARYLMQNLHPLQAILLFLQLKNLLLHCCLHCKHSDSISDAIIGDNSMNLS